MNLGNRESTDLIHELKYFTGAHTTHQIEGDLILFKAGEVGEAIPALAWELIQRGALQKVKVILEQSKEVSHIWLCNSAGYQFTH